MDSRAEFYRYSWGNNPVREALKNKLCRLLVVARLNSVLIEMVDTGEQVITDRRALRRVRNERRTG